MMAFFCNAKVGLPHEIERIGIPAIQVCIPNSSIPVLSTPDCPISKIEKFLDEASLEELMETCHQSGFSEIWIAGHTEVDAYGNIELFGLLPVEHFGHHTNHSRRKPYG
jgi:hypothetical protein